MDPGGLLAKLLEDAEDLEQACFLTAGAVSGCWENLRNAGVFESDRAKAHTEALIHWINTHYEKKEK